MWIMQVREEKGEEDIWEVLQEVKPFALEALVTVGKPPPFPRGAATTSKQSPSSSPPTSKGGRKHKFRIVLHYNRLDMVVAVAADTFIANQHWTFIQENLVAQFQALLPSSASSSVSSPSPSSPYVQRHVASITTSSPLVVPSVSSSPPRSPLLHFSASTNSLFSLSSSSSPGSSPSSSPGPSAHSSHSSPASSHSHSHFGFASLKARPLSKKPKKKKLKDSPSSSTSSSPTSTSPSSSSFLSGTPPTSRRNDDEDQAVYQFLTLKFTTLTKVETQKEFEQDEKMMKKWNMPTTEMGSLATFHELFETDEAILGFFNCSLWRKRVHLGGLYVSQSHLCFGSSPLRRRFIFPFSSITQLEATSEKDELYTCFPDAVKIVTKGKTYLLFQFVGAQEVLPTITDLWHKSISDTASTIAGGFPGPGVRASSPRESVDPRGERGDKTNLHLDSRSRTATSALNNPMMSMPLGETPAELDKCQLRMKGEVVGAIGQFFVSFKWISFTASSASVIIPFRYVTAMTKSQTRNTIRVDTPTNSCKFAFSSLQKRQSVFKVLSDIWDTNKNVQQSLISCNTIDEILQNLDTEKGDDLKAKIVTVMKKDMRLTSDSAADRHWNVFLAKHGRGVDMIKTSQLKYLIRDGIPNSLRRRMWQICSLSVYRMVYPSISNSYAALLRRVERQLASTKDSEAIEKDLKRSLRGIFIYDDEVAMGSLRRVLKAFSLRNTQIGYCQSMNMITALLLLYMTEEEAYWLLCTLCEDILPEYYSENMVGCLVDQQVFQSLTAECLPKLFQQAQELGVSLEIVSIPWFLCIFINILPWNSTLRVLDRLFAEGSVVLFQVAVSLLHVNEAKLLGAKDNMQFMDILKHQLNMEWSSDFEATLKTFASEITSEKIKLLRRTYRPGILRTLGIAGLPEGVTISAHGSIMLTINSDMLQLLQNTENLNKLITKFMGIPDDRARTKMVHAPVSRSYSHTALGTSDDVTKARELSRHSCVPDDQGPRSSSWVPSSNSHKEEHKEEVAGTVGRKQFLGGEKLMEMAKGSHSSPSLLREELNRVPNSPTTARPTPPPRSSMRLKAMTEMSPPLPSAFSGDTPSSPSSSPTVTFAVPPSTRSLPKPLPKNWVSKSPANTGRPNLEISSQPIPIPTFSTPVQPTPVPGLQVTISEQTVISVPSPPNPAPTTLVLVSVPTSTTVLASAPAPASALAPPPDPATHSDPTSAPFPSRTTTSPAKTKPTLPPRTLSSGPSSELSSPNSGWLRKGSPSPGVKQQPQNNASHPSTHPPTLPVPKEPTSTPSASVISTSSTSKGSPSPRSLQNSGSLTNVFSVVSTTSPPRSLPSATKRGGVPFRGPTPGSGTGGSNPTNRGLPVQPTRQSTNITQLMKSPSPKEATPSPSVTASATKSSSPTISPSPSPVPSPTPSPVPSPRGSNPTPLLSLVPPSTPKETVTGGVSPSPGTSSSKGPPSPRGTGTKLPPRNLPPIVSETPSWLGRGTGTSVRGSSRGARGNAGPSIQQGTGPPSTGRGGGGNSPVVVSVSSTGSATASSPAPSFASPSVTVPASKSTPTVSGSLATSLRGGPVVRGPGPSRFPRGSPSNI